MNDQNLYKLSFGVNSGSRSNSNWRAVLNFGSKAGSSYSCGMFCSKFRIYNQWSRYLLTGPKNGIGPKPEPENPGKHTFSLVSLRK